MYLKETQDLKEELACVCLSLVHPQRSRIRFVARVLTTLYKCAYFGNPCQTVPVLKVLFIDEDIFHEDQ